MVHFIEKEEEGLGKRLQIRGWFLEKIRSGAFKPGEAVPTRHDLSNIFSCSRATADFVINGLVREKVLSACRGKGTFLLPPGGRTVVDAFALVNCNPLFLWSMEIEEELTKTVGRKARLVRFTPEQIRFPAEWEACKSHKLVAFIMPEAEHASFLRDVLKNEIPHLVLYRDPPESPFINIDHRAAGRAIVAALKEKGCRRLAWVSRTESRFKTPEERYAGFLEGLLEQGLPFKREWGEFVLPGMEVSYLLSLFSASERPDALVVAQAPMGQVLHAVQEAALTPGKDIIIASLDELEPAQYPYPILCAQRLTRQIGRKAGRFLLHYGTMTEGAPLRCFLAPKIVTVRNRRV
ncbi:MAG: hypothetical protein A2487_18160 [Candidatus Raymondbacteria bacterium RifOxyC12_full_50_8]|uniref:HTH gntR-type domain-containing protein n=1 Tax=Candidatus Raymondbacteria bacterium RIFOXYD12_FULL_49_13 TaxID=1817890 RepID=A0A1F7F5F3_UNCRA|nr:MAG: hypothetical protein A2350_19395 [Candidatus Raymondbacteria bacterium RifOxyB12_full_50_8]OGJ87190.1 MAG: hypothetical protein A2248_04120 [Candidatus Raymondbacteria bacterium RIFOXYA2_FULL_49_16]OGJ95329.1 MAG: hypothetical protein A2487_18160 [Candidatus Raymondbacteria bacterium RifOxyC12_full_50_8]OGK01808.1 MAG: hypothetical protein A2519_03005 [Candidatus Raymondbacteria bacterium RIFOXYD12_FULL_49_13]OGP41186.1 MAG: hypothetical protein A2324_08765 [Candidatus Raymondbacteria b